jgi:hypothetical protein
MIWIVLHWIFLYVCKPHYLFHGAAAFLALLFQLLRKKKVKWKNNIQNTVGIVMMYVGYYICEELWHFSFLPFWTVSIVGLRRKIVPLLLFSVVTGLVLHFIVLKQVAGHVIMNVGRTLRTGKVSIDNIILSHGCLFVLGSMILNREFIITQREVLAVISTLHMVNKFERMDIFSLCMCYTHFFALLMPLLHLFMPYWYNCYENNHFYMVKRQYLFIIPIGILVQRVLYSVI